MMKATNIYDQSEIWDWLCPILCLGSPLGQRSTQHAIPVRRTESFSWTKRPRRSCLPSDRNDWMQNYWGHVRTFTSTCTRKWNLSVRQTTHKKSHATGAYTHAGHWWVIPVILCGYKAHLWYKRGLDKSHKLATLYHFPAFPPQNQNPKGKA